MGRFDGVLLVSDFDNTLLYTDAALHGEGACPTMSARNVENIRRFMAEGGRFAVATGRAMGAYRPYDAMVPTNAPAIVDNGAAIYDYESQRYLHSSTLSGQVLVHLGAILERWPDIALELYHPEGDLQVFQPTEWNLRHAKLTGLNFHEVADIAPTTVPLPLSKALLVAPPETLEAVCAFAAQSDWGAQYELIFSSDHLLEMTARGANKGAMVLRLKELLGCRTLLCAGDHKNDLPMLQVADGAFCPANAVPEVLSSGCQVVCHALEGAVGEIIEGLWGDFGPRAE